MDERTEAAQSLVGALEVMLRISEEQSVDLASSRDRARALEEIFETRLEARLEGMPSTRSPGMGDLMGEFQHASGEHSRQAERERAFLTAFQSLMILYADPATKHVSSEVFSLLSQIRMIDVGEDPAVFGSDIPKPDLDVVGDDASDRKRAVLGSILDHQRKMRSFMEERNANWDQQIQRSDALLAKALELARGMLTD